MRPIRERLSWVGAFCVCCLLVSCGGTDDEPPGERTAQFDEARVEPRPMARVGGVQDIWPFSFGLDALRTDVEETLGSPASIDSRSAGESDAVVITWEYENLELSFFVSRAEKAEYLLTARFLDSSIELGSGLRIGMDPEEAIDILGQPGFRSGDTLVYFYYATTIELVVRDDTVVEIVLARALP